MYEMKIYYENIFSLSSSDINNSKLDTDKNDSLIDHENRIDDEILEGDRQYYYDANVFEHVDNNKLNDNISLNINEVLTLDGFRHNNVRWLSEKINVYQNLYEEWEVAWIRKTNNNSNNECET